MFYEAHHLKKVCMTYIEHACFSLKLSGCFFLGGVCAYIHALIPNRFTKTSTQICKYIQDEIRKNGCKKGEEDRSIYYDESMRD